jgi:GT2 family glycosyltransferase
MNAVLVLTHNCLELTKRCIASVRAQDIPVYLLVYDNNSTDGTPEWLAHDGIVDMGIFSPENKGVSTGWNRGLETLFNDYGANHVLVINNDVVLPPWFYSKLLKCKVPFVTGVSVESAESIKRIDKVPENATLTPGPDFSSFLIRREAWETIGIFDERMKFYAQDCDYDVRAHKLGMTLWNAHVPFYHERSSTLRQATDAERQQIENQANCDRKVFRQKHNCLPGTPEYGMLFQTIANR